MVHDAPYSKEGGATKGMVRLLDSELSDPEFETFWGCDAKRVADLALTATAGAAIATIPAVFLHSSKYETLQTVGNVLGFAIWLIFLTETLIMVRLHHGWGGDWLKTHKLQLVVIVLANPLLGWAIGRYEALELSTLLPLPSFLQSAKLMKLFKFSKVLKFLHLGEIATKVRVALSHVPWAVNSVLLLSGLLGLGIVGTALEGDAATPAHALDVWFEIGHSVIEAAPEVLIASLPLCAVVAAAITWHKKSVATT